MTAKPRVLFLGNTTFDLPLAPGLARKWDALSGMFDLRVIARAGTLEAGDPRFRLLRPAPHALRGASFYGPLPLAVAQELRRFRPQAIVNQSPFEALCALAARAAVRSEARVVTELHGDWRTAARLYGSRGRALYAGLADRLAVLALRRSDATRAVSAFTAQLAETATGRAPAAVFPTYFDIASFMRHPPRPLPEGPALAWVAVLERPKNPRLLAEAWRLAATRVPEARLVMVGRGRLQAIADELVREFPTRVRAIPRLSPEEVAAVLDESTALVLSSESEGLPRVIMEAFARGRAVVSTAAGGIPDIVDSERNGLLVARGDAAGLADAMTRVLADRDLAERLGREAHRTAQALEGTPDRYAAAMARLVDQIAR